MFAKGYFRAFFRVCTEEIGSEETNCSFLRTSYMGISQGCVFYLLTRIFWVADSHLPKGRNLPSTRCCWVVSNQRTLWLWTHAVLYKYCNCVWVLGAYELWKICCLGWVWKLELVDHSTQNNSRRYRPKPKRIIIYYYFLLYSRKKSVNLHTRGQPVKMTKKHPAPGPPLTSYG